eukprot:697079-Amphidinium_carterae.1
MARLIQMLLGTAGPTLLLKCTTSGGWWARSFVNDQTMNLEPGYRLNQQSKPLQFQSVNRIFLKPLFRLDLTSG